MPRGRITFIAFVLVLAAAGGAAAWGAAGHDMVARVAVEGLPASMPGFFTRAADHLAYLGPEPDRWRSDELSVMDEAWKYDHYIDIENVPAGALDAADRFDYLAIVYDADLDDPVRDTGLLPWRILELYQRLTTGFARWRLTESPDRKAWIEQRILNDAGVLGHYVADAAQPHHTTIHFNGWADGAPNPRGFTTSNDFHFRFETAFVGAHITAAELRRATPHGVLPLNDVRTAVMDYVRASNDQVVPLYELELRFGFDPATTPDPALERFTLDRLAAAATMLRSLWLQAWRDSEAVAARLEDWQR